LSAEAPAGESLDANKRGRRDVRRHLRGSSLLLSGRFASLAINLAAQVLTVRYLAREDYGMFAWAMVVVAAVTQFTLLGFDTAAARFVAVYVERGDLPRVFGALALSTGVIGGTSLLVGLGALAAGGSLPRLLGAEPAAVQVLLALLAMAPLQGLEAVLHSLFGVFGRARSILVRRHLVGPGLKLASVLAVMALGGDAFDLALAYTASFAVGVALYGAAFVGLLRRGEYLARWRPRRLELPAREMFVFAASLGGAELVFFFYNSFIGILLEYFHGASEIAGFQAARPFAKLNDVAMVAFIHLFVPALARFHARGDRGGSEHLYVQTSLWIALLSFPLFAATFGMADAVAPLLLGAQYPDAGRLLAWMAAGFFVHAALGANPHALRTLGYVRVALAVDGLSIALALAVAFALIPLAGAAGAAATLALVLGLRGLLYLAALRRVTGLSPLRGCAGSYAAIASGAAALAVARPFVGGSVVASAAVTAAVTFGVLWRARRGLELEETFPELARVPLLRRVLGPPRGEAAAPGSHGAR
jgi:O-antigen/teichoic acid export membrane protein